MAKSPKNDSDWTLLPVLTEIVGDLPPEIPVLTEEARNRKKLAQDGSTMSAEEIAEQVAPQLEKLLRAKLHAQFEAMWLETWRQTRAGLPDLIRTQLATPARGISGSDADSLDIIPPASASVAAKKAGNSKISSTRLNIKEPKKK